MEAAPPFAVVGAGIVGVAAALELQRRGLPVLLIDKGAPGHGASFGNLASIAVSEFLPASRPGIWRQVPRWMLMPDGPVRFAPGYVPRMVPWLVRFVLAGLPKRMQAIEADGAALCARALPDWEALLAKVGISGMLSETGCLAIHASEAEFSAMAPHLAVLRRFGVPYEVLDGGAARALEPDLGSTVHQAVLLPQNRTVRDPHGLVLALMDSFLSGGGTFAAGEVRAFERADGRLVAMRLGDGRRLAVAGALLCAGAATGRLAPLLDERIPLETERGYHTQIAAPGVNLRHSLIWPARAFMVSPTAGGIRVGGSVEMAGLDAPPNFRRARVLVRHARQVLPRLRCDEATEWMGHRPALPDTVPVIGPSATTRGVLYATGHGHLGVTLAATTAHLVADMAMGRPAALDMAPYRLNRF